MPFLDQEKYRINGVIDTAKPVYKNIEAIANACNTWVTYDGNLGKWSFIINTSTDATYSFDDSNIIGNITVIGTPVTELANAVEVQFPRKELDDQPEFVRAEVHPSLVLPYEADNTLTISSSLINDIAQAQVVGLTDLRQNRASLVITFSTDHTCFTDVKAGDVVTVDNSNFGWSDKEFRVLRLEEVEEEGVLLANVTALEYNEYVYNFSIDINGNPIGDATPIIYVGVDPDDGIVAQGAIGKPGQPIVTKFEIDTRPMIQINSTVPDNTDPLNLAGIVEGMEFWIYSIPAEELPTWQFVDDTLRTYTLAATVPASSNKAVFDPGEIATHTLDALDAGNFLVKTRGVNATSSGPFSEKSGLIEYAPVQVAGAISDQTIAIDQGEILLKTIGAGLLLKYLSELIAEKVTAPGGLFDSFNTAFQNVTGINLVETFGGNTIGPSVPPGGTTGQVLAKIDGTDYNTHWVDAGLGPPPALGFTPDYMVFSLDFDTGSDLDIRVRVIDPNIGQLAVPGDCIGWSANSTWSHLGQTILEWGGDNTGTGRESVLIRLNNLLAVLPATDYLVVEVRAFWYGTAGIGATPWVDLSSGGAPVVNSFLWENPTATNSLQAYGDLQLVTTQSTSSSTPGDVIGYLSYDIAAQTVNWSKTL